MHEEQFWILASKKVTGEASPQELDMLKIFMDADPVRKNILESMEEFWASQNPQKQQASFLKSENAYLAHINRMKMKGLELKSHSAVLSTPILPFSEKEKPFYKKQVVYWLATLVIIGFIGVFSLKAKQQPAINTESAPNLQNVSNEVSISAGSRSKIQLPDGSQVWINSSSKLSYSKSFSPKMREVYLDGEAYFDVVHDPAHPFIVHTSTIDIKALGTAFNVKSYDADPTIEATLIHGSIEVSRPGQPNAPKILLKPHEKLVLNKNVEPRLKAGSANSSHVNFTNAILVSSVKRNRPDSEIVETAWVYNKLAFEDTRLSDIAHQMEKWYKVEIIIESSKLGDYTLTGSFVNENLDEALKMLQYLVPFKYVIKDDKVKIYDK